MWTWVASIKTPDELTEPRCLSHQRCAYVIMFHSLALHLKDSCCNMRGTGEHLLSTPSQQSLC